MSKYGVKATKVIFCVLLINVTQKATGTLNCCYCYPLSFSIVYLHPRHKHLFLQGYLPIHAFWQFHAQIVEEVNGIQCSRASGGSHRVYTGRERRGATRPKYNRTHYNQWCCVTDYTGCGAAQQIPAVKWCLALFMTYRHKVEMICNGCFVASSVDRLLGRSHGANKNAWKTLSPSLTKHTGACAFVASGVAKQPWPALSTTTREVSTNRAPDKKNRVRSHWLL